MFTPSHISSSSSSSQFSNNPFIDDPTNSSSRYPDINAFERSGGGGVGASYAPQPQQPQVQQSGGYGYGYDNGGGFTGMNGYGGAASGYSGGGGLGAQPTGYFGGAQQQQQPYGGGGGPGFGAPSPQYGGGSQLGGSLMTQPTGYYAGQQQQQPSYGQQFPQQQQYTGYQSAPPQMQYTGMGYGYQSQDPGYGGYGVQQQQQQPQPQQQTGAYLNLNEFDPLSAGANGGSSGPQGPGPDGAVHPRDFVYAHKAELEAWDLTAWKQAEGTFVGLRNAWDSRRENIVRQGLRGYVGLAEKQRLEGLQKEAEQSIDIVAAATEQMSEVRQSYRQSADFASKNRVRESLNAALKSLPGWPPAS